ncbi:nucleolar protein 58 [Enteropsectra breve]|nr:nucleolar protein 58 [Enteropsectra breve]KAI5151885.1 nucleolar protein 58 [Enteropsectra breve]
MLYFLETPVGIALIKKQDGFVLENKLIYSSNSTAVNISKALADLHGSEWLPAEIDKFIRENVPAGTVLNVMDSDLVPLLEQKYKLIVKNIVDSDFRKLKNNSFKWFGLNKDVYNAFAARVAHKMTGEKIEDHFIVETINIIEKYNVNINNRIMRVREWYSLHFPELNEVSDNSQYIKYILEIGDRDEYLNSKAEESELPGKIIEQMKNSMGIEMKKADLEKIRDCVEGILADMDYRAKLFEELKHKCKSSCPNLSELIDEGLIAKLLRKAGDLSLLAQQPASTIQIYGSEKAYNEAVKNSANTPKHGIIFEAPIICQSDSSLQGKLARILANKISLCARADLAKECTDGSFGKTCRDKIEDALEKMKNGSKKSAKPIKKQNRKYIAVKDYEEGQDSRKKIKRE